MYLKLVLKPLKLKFMFGTNVFVKQVLYIEVLNEFLANCFFSENREMLPHDRDMAYHDRE